MKNLQANIYMIFFWLIALSGFTMIMIMGLAKDIDKVKKEILFLKKECN